MRVLRKLKGYTQEDLAAKVGTSQNTISRLESGTTRRLSDALRLRIALALEVHPYTLFPYLDETGAA